MPPGLRRIAEEAGVSVATASRVINNTRPVSAPTRARVLEAVERLGYHPSAAARSLRTRRSNVVGVLIPSLSNPYFTEVLRAVEHETRQAGYVVLVCSSDHDVEHERRALDTLISHGVDGTLVCVADSHRSDLSALHQAGVHVVLIAREVHDRLHDAVVHDDRQATYMATSYLLERGYERIAIITGAQRLSTSSERLEGYRSALAHRGHPSRDEYVLVEEYDERPGVQLAREVLTQRPAPDALLIGSNLTTREVYRLVMDLDVQVPEQLAIVGLDNSDWTSLVVPPLTVIQQSPYEIGRHATRTLIRRMSEDEHGEVERLVVPSKFIVRSST